MSTTPSKHQASGIETEARPQSENVAARIDRILHHFDMIPSKAEQHIVRYAYLYLFGFLFLYIALLIVGGVFLGYLKNTVYVSFNVPIVEAALLAVVGMSLVLWTFNVWQEHVPHILRDAFSQRRIAVPTGDLNTHYLGFLEHYRNALISPRRYLLIGSLVVVMAIYVVYILYSSIMSIFTYSLNITDIIFFSTRSFLSALIELGVAYCLGIVVWVLYISGSYIKKLSRAFEFRIEPVHPDNCGGLELLGRYCFGLVSPVIIGSAFFVGFIFVVLRNPTTGAFDLAAVSLIIFIILLYGIPVAIFAFFLPLWNIHMKMLRERKIAEETYVAHIAALREQIQVLLDDNQLEEAKAVKGKKELMEALYIPSPTWPFNVRAKLFSTFIGAGGSFLLGFLTALPPIILQLFFKP